ncbi:MAG: Crp/Fnr family transcriptional regulator [Chitinophagaceae bacterium]|jgi:CRP/FNR family transcriptional regulator|nr:Crp/Fnr family transcriptional regulator [Chitinophagaceae bacterium]
MIENAKDLRAIFPEFEPALMEDILSCCAMREIPAGTVIMRSGQFIRSTVLVLEGLIKVYRTDDDGNEFFMYHLGPGDACALSMTCAISSEKSAISAKTSKDSTLMMIPIEKMDEWMSEYRSWYQFVVKTYRIRFDELLQTLDSVAFRHMDERIEFYLKRHKEKLGTNIIPVTHQEIAQELNSSREVISRLLKKLSEMGKIKLNRYNIEIIDL